MARRHRPTEGIVRTLLEEIDLTLPGGETVEVNFTRVTEWEYDAHYGADADGNRGMPMTGFMDSDPEGVTINHDDCPSTPLEDEPRDRQAEILSAIEAWEKEHPAEEPEDDGEDDHNPWDDDGD